MSTAHELDQQYPNSRSAEDRVLLHNVSWATYEKLLDGLANQSAPRLTYDHGMLEIMSPGPLHERLTCVLEAIIDRFAEEINLNIYCLRSTTFKRKIFQRGFEPDSCFYVRNEGRVRGKDKLDLRVDPAPDLVIEIDITGASIDKFPIFAQMQIPELWLHDGNKLTIYTLQSGVYSESANSKSFPPIKSLEASKFVQQTEDLPSTEFLKALRKWISGLNTA